MDQTERNKRKIKKGVVVSNKAQKTVVVSVSRTTQHPDYGKTIRIAKKYYAHNELPNVQIGDTVTIVETRPISKLKRWRIVEEKV